jgi:hypothetical protein
MLEVRYKGRTIAEVLDMTIEEAAEFFGIAVPSAATSPASPRRRPLLPAWPLPLRSVADLLAGHHARQDQFCRPPDRDRVQANPRPSTWRATPITMGRMQTVTRPSMMASQKNQLSAITAGITVPRR